MSDDVMEMLERATPGDVERLDYGRLAERGRRRHRVRRAAGGVGAVALTVAGALGVASVVAPPDRPLEVLAEPQPGVIAEWTTVASGLPGGTNDAHSWVTSDGRVLLYGGTRGIDGPPEPGGILVDPDTGEATSFGDPDVDIGPFRRPEFADDKLLVFGGEDGTPSGAVFDVATMIWSTVPPVVMDNVAPQILAWDGTTLVAGDTFRINQIESLGLDGNLRLWQWELGDEQWTELPETPVDAGRLETAFSDGKLAVWTNDAPLHPDGGERPGLTADAEVRESRLAVLDVATGEWAIANRRSLPELGDGDEATIGWLDGRVVVVPLPAFGTGGLDGPDVEPEPIDLPAPTAWNPDSGAWEQLAEVPAVLQETRMRVRQSGSRSDAQGEPIQAQLRDRILAVLLDDGTWTLPVDADTVVRVGADLVALQGTTRQSGPVTASVWTGQGWAQVEGDVGHHRFGSVAANDDALYLTGGWQARFGFVPDSNRDMIRLNITTQ